MLVFERGLVYVSGLLRLYGVAVDVMFVVMELVIIDGDFWVVDGGEVSNVGVVVV